MRTIAIIGGGFCGTMTAVHVLRECVRPLRIVLIERTGRFTAGVAYGTTCPAHVLNVPAGRMSALDDEPDHFVRWLKARDPECTGGAFVARRVYGTYLRSVLEGAGTAARGRHELECVPGDVVDVNHGDDVVRLTFSDGRVIAADVAVLATGNFPPADVLPQGHPFLSSPKYAGDPWSPAALQSPRHEPALLVGTGLTMVDMVLLLKEAGHIGTIHAVSRRGLLPQPHRATTTHAPHPEEPEDIDQWGGTARGILRALRAEVDRHAAHGVDWRDVLTSIRAKTPALWQSLNTDERAKFLRHLRPFWETHRHRAAPQAWETIEGMLASRQLRVMAGRVLDLRDESGGVTAIIRQRGTYVPEGLRCGVVINCTGPDTNLARVREPLIVNLRNRGMIRPDPLGLGLETAADGGLLNASGQVLERLFLAGPLRKGALWENTAVPELRSEAAALARRLIRLVADAASQAA